MTLILKNTTLRHGDATLFSPTSMSPSPRHGYSPRQTRGPLFLKFEATMHIFSMAKISFVRFLGNRAAPCVDHHIIPLLQFSSGFTNTWLSINMTSVRNPQYTRHIPYQLAEQPILDMHTIKEVGKLLPLGKNSPLGGCGW